MSDIYSIGSNIPLGIPQKIEQIVQLQNRIAQLEAELAQSQAALKMAREWSKGDKWRFSEVAQEYEAWENYADVLDAAIKEQQ